MPTPNLSPILHGPERIMEQPLLTRRMRREAQTVEHMIRRYCTDHHQHTQSLCPDCVNLLDYAHKRLRACPFQEHKTTCSRCPVHCYAPARRARIQQVMRYAGPRMLFSHPLLAILHLIDGLRKPQRSRNSPP